MNGIDGIFIAAVDSVGRMARPPSRRRARTLTVALESVTRDRRHGARFLSERVLRILETAGRRPSAGLRRELRTFAAALRRSQPAMAAFQNWALELEHVARTASGPKVGAELGIWVRLRRREARRERRGVVATARRFRRGGVRVLTLSRSESVRDALTAPPRGGRPASVTVLRSDPGGEGRLFAAELRRGGLAARCVPDRLAPAALRSSDLVMIGADAVERDGSVVHKVGTRRLASAALRADRSVVVVAGSSKWLHRRRLPAPLPALFDRTPGRWVSEYWTDSGRRRGGRPASPSGGRPEMSSSSESG